MTTQLEPGADTDARVAKAIGWKYEPDFGWMQRLPFPGLLDGNTRRVLPKPYSTDANAAMQAAEACGLFNTFGIVAGKGEIDGWCVYEWNPGLRAITPECDTLPLAICAAILQLKEKP